MTDDERPIKDSSGSSKNYDDVTRRGDEKTRI